MGLMQPRISLITLGVSNLARSRRFYEQGLGWIPSQRWSQEDVVFFQLGGGLVLALYPRIALAEDAGLPAAQSTGFSGISLAYNVYEQDEVAPILKQAQQAGGTLLKPAQDTFWGGHSGYFADPDGYAWEVAWNPHFELTPDGQLRLPD